jgi:uncharacterized caspase-like protein
MTFPSVPRVDINSLAVGAQVGRGGQGRVLTVSEYRVNGQWPAVLKIYSPALIARLDAAVLEKMVSLPGQLPPEDGQWLLNNTAWPTAIAEDRGVVSGFVMRMVPDAFYFSFQTQTQGTRRLLADTAFLLNPDSYLTSAGLTVSDSDRLAVLSSVAATLSRLHALGVVVGDLSPKNVLFSLAPSPGCFLIDCDAVQLRGETVFPQVETPDWEGPHGEAKATTASDAYKLGLLAIRLFARDQSSRDPAALGALSAELGQLAMLSQDLDPARRPPPSAWVSAFGAAGRPAPTALVVAEPAVSAPGGFSGSPGIRLAPDPPDEPRVALVVATTRYEDPELRQLRAPAHDAEDLAEVLGDPGIGAFAVTRVIDQDERRVRREIDVFLSSRSTGDLLVVYLSCHGVLDRRNRLYFAAVDTLKTQLGSTGIPSAWLLDELEECRARRQVLILDCCFSGAFAHGGKGDEDLDLERRLTGQGRGRVVLTASRAGEYSFEGQALPGAVSAGSVFTTGLVKGLRTGAADVGGDGYVSVDEAFDYAYGYVRSSGASQTPQRWLYGGEGAIVLARSPAGIVITPAPLPEALAASLDSPYPAVRIGAVNALGEWLSGDPARALTAEQKLQQIAETDVPTVAAAARACLHNLKSVGTERNG